MITPELVRDYRQFQNSGAYCTPPGRAACAIRSARTLAEWRQAQRGNLVRLRAIPEEENYFDIYGVPNDEKERKSLESILEKWGCYCVVSEVNQGNGTRNDWKRADSIGMCVYANPLDPFENCYIVDLMRAALDAIPQPGEVDL